MATHGAHRTITFTAQTLLSVVEEFLTWVTTTRTAQSLPGDRFLLGFAVDNAEVPGLVEDAVADILAVATEHNAVVLDCDVSGLRRTGDGYRLWGTIECVGPAVSSGNALAIGHGDLRVEQVSPESWRLVAHIRSGGPA